MDLIFKDLAPATARLMIDFYEGKHRENMNAELAKSDLKPLDPPGERPAQPRMNHGDFKWLQANKTRWDFLVREKKLTMDQFKAALAAIKKQYQDGEKVPYLSAWVEDATPQEVYDVLREAP